MQKTPPFLGDNISLTLNCISLSLVSVLSYAIGNQDGLVQPGPFFDPLCWFFLILVHRSFMATYSLRINWANDTPETVDRVNQELVNTLWRNRIADVGDQPSERTTVTITQESKSEAESICVRVTEEIIAAVLAENRRTIQEL